MNQSSMQANKAGFFINRGRLHDGSLVPAEALACDFQAA